MKAREILEKVENMSNELSLLEDATCIDDPYMKDISHYLYDAMKTLELVETKLMKICREEDEKEEYENDKAEREETRAYERSIAGSQGFPPRRKG